MQLQQEERSEHGELLSKEERDLIEGDDNRVLRFDQAAWLFWWGGTALIVLSWLSVVSSFVGWIGFAAALASTFISIIVRKYWKIPS